MRAHVLALILLTAMQVPHAFAAEAGATGDTKASTSAGDVPFITGGVGLEERDALRTKSGEYNLKLRFAKTDGAYLGAVNVGISDGRGRQVLSTETDGPWILAKLRPGRYHVKATANDRTVSRDVTVTGRGQKSLTLFW